QLVDLDVVAAARLSLEAPVASRDARALALTDELHAGLPPQPPAQLAALRVEHVAQEPWPSHDPGHLRVAAICDALGQLVGDEAATHDEHPIGPVRLAD